MSTAGYSASQTGLARSPGRPWVKPDADAVIAEQVACFAALREKFGWKVYDYDRPSDLARRPAAAGFAAVGEESLMVGATARR